MIIYKIEIQQSCIHTHVDKKGNTKNNKPRLVNQSMVGHIPPHLTPPTQVWRVAYEH